MHAIRMRTKKTFTTEDDIFNNHFDIKARNEQDVNRVLTPQIRENLMVLAEDIESFGISYIGNTIYIGINTCRDTFDIKKGMGKVNFDYEIVKVRKDVQSMIDWIELLVLGSKKRNDKILEENQFIKNWENDVLNRGTKNGYVHGYSHQYFL